MRHNKLRRAIPSEVYFKRPYKSGVFSVIICLVQWVVSQQSQRYPAFFFGITKTMRHNPKTIEVPRKAAEPSTSTERNAVPDSEIWKPIPFLKGYEASNFGKIRRDNSTLPTSRNASRYVGSILKPSINNHGYWRIKIGVKTYAVHRLVAMTFIENTLKKEQVNHINGVKSDNSVTNLEWSTQSENIRHALKTGLKKGIPTTNYQNLLIYSNPKLSNDKIIEIHKKYGDRNIVKCSHKTLAKEYGVCRDTIGRILRNQPLYTNLQFSAQ